MSLASLDSAASQSEIAGRDVADPLRHLRARFHLPDDTIYLAIDADKAHVFDGASGKRLA